jgi:hypothetical protein
VVVVVRTIDIEKAHMGHRPKERVSAIENARCGETDPTQEMRLERGYNRGCPPLDSSGMINVTYLSLQTT